MQELQKQINHLNGAIKNCPPGLHKRDLIGQIKKLRKEEKENEQK